MVAGYTMGLYFLHGDHANVLIPLKDVKYEGIWKRLHVRPTMNVDTAGWIQGASTSPYL